MSFIHFKDHPRHSMLLEPIHLIHAATVAASVQGCFILWHKPGLRAASVFILIVGAAALLNILEETGLIDTLRLTPVFLLLFGPGFYVATRGLTHISLTKQDLLHGIPAIVALAFTQHVQAIIAIGTLSRLGYAVFTTRMLYQFARRLDAERSDSQEYSFTWLIWLIAIITAFNIIDLVRLNAQPLLSLELNVFGQTINNLVWLIAIVYMTVKFSQQHLPPALEHKIDIATPDNNDQQTSATGENAAQYQPIFDAIDKQIQSESLFQTERLTLAQLAESTGFQSRDISRAINLVTGKSFNEYINGMRVDYVCQLIADKPHGTLTELAFEAGFSSKSVFNKSFRQVTGKTPSQYKSEREQS